MMVQTMEAVFDGTVLRPDAPLPLEANTRVRITLETLPASETDSVWNLLAQTAGSVEAPSDWAGQHDHYLYGNPKQEAI